MEKSTFKCKMDPLEGKSNWDTWKYKVLIVLKSIPRALDVIEGRLTSDEESEVSGTAASDAAVPAFTKADSSALFFITNNMTEDMLRKVMRFTSAREIWLELHRMFDGTNEDKTFQLCMSFFGLKKNPTDDAATHLSKLKNIWTSLNKELGDDKKLPDLLLICKTLDTLGEEYNQFKSGWLMCPTSERTVENLTDRLCVYERNMIASIVSPDQEALASSSTQNGNKKKSKDCKIKCNYCLIKGHRVRDCKKWIQDGRPPKSSNPPSSSQKESQIAEVLTSEISDHEVSATSSTTVNWFVDNGATCHITNRGDLFQTFEPFEHNNMHTVSTANGNALQAKGKGNISILSEVQRKVHEITLKDVWYVPQITKNLFSVLAAHDCNSNSRFESTPTNCTFYTRNEVKMTGVRSISGGLYKLNVKNVIPKRNIEVNLTLTKTQLYHERLVHQNKRHVRKFVKQELGIELPQDESTCESCILGKSHRLKFGTRPRASRPGELVHSDVCGPFPNSFTNLRYFVLFKDDFTGYRYVYFLKAKSEVKQKMQEFIAEARNTNHSIETLLSDNGGEFDNKEVREILATHGIKQRLTMPYTPEQNGCSERENRTLVEAARTVMNSGSFEQRLWAELVNAVAYVLNRTGPSRTENKAPYELWHGKKPKISHLRILGCTAYVHVPKQKRRKLSMKALKGRLIGYDNDDGYRIWCDNNNLIRSRDVIFDEKPLDRIQCDDVISPTTKNETPFNEYELKVSFNPERIEAHQDSTTSHQHEQSELDPVDQIDAKEQQEESRPSEFTEEIPARDEMSRPTSAVWYDADVDHSSDSEDETMTHTYNLRDRSIIRPPQKFRDCCALTDVEAEPTTFKEAMKSPNKDEWIKAMLKEISSLKENNTWSLQELPQDRKAIPCKWVFKIKKNPDGSIDKYKARLVAKGFKQRKGVDYEETYSPVARFATIRSLLSVAASERMYLTQFDVTTAFLYGELEEELYMQQPEGFHDGSSRVCYLNRSLYGLKQAPRCWNHRFHKVLHELGFKQSTADPCLYTKKVGGKQILLTLYVDDGLVAASDKQLADEFLENLKEKLKITTKPASYYLGMEITQCNDGTIVIHQEAYTKKILERFNMANSNPVSTPIDAAENSSAPQFVEENRNNEEINFPYREAVGALAYLMVATRPDIAYAVGVVSRNLEKPTRNDWNKVKRILRYLKGTTSLAIQYKPKTMKLPELEGFSDADYGGDTTTGRSTTGIVCRYAGGPVSWTSKRQTSVALSTTEAELVAASEGARELVWLTRIFEDLTKKKSVPNLHVDNEAAVRLAHNPEFHKRTKHIRIRHFFVRELVSEGAIFVKRIGTRDQIADIMTKGLPKPTFVRMKSALALV